MEIETFKVKGINVANVHNSSGIAFFGISVLAGANYETPDIAGIAHFSEHLFFRGTETKNWKQLNESFAKLGVNQNAYTSNSEVLYFSSCPIDNLEKVVDLMLDMFFHSTLPNEEMEKERTIIKEEKKMYEDDPKSVFSDAVGSNFFAWNVGHATIGEFDTIQSISGEQIRQYLKGKTNLDNFICICVGDVKSEDLKRYIEKNIPDNHDYLKEGTGLNSIDTSKYWNEDLLLATKAQKIKFQMQRENITQSNICMIIDALSADDPSIYEEHVLCEALGGGMYSKLFSRIREELGLCYVIGMSANTLSYPDKRILQLYGSTSPENVDRFILESEKVLQEIMKNGLDDNIFECAKTDYLASVLRHTETSVGKAMFLNKRLLIHKSASIESVVNKIRKVTRQDCNELARKILDKEYNWAVMNPKVLK
jgi:predicted Zn-dependent peptidase